MSEIKVGDTVRVIVGDDGTGDEPQACGEHGHFLLLGSKATVTKVADGALTVRGFTRRNGDNLITQSITLDDVELVEGA